MLAGIYAARAGTLVLLPFVSSPEGLFLFAVAFGLADFATVPPTTSLTRSLFRAGGWALALGLIGGAHQAGAALGAFLGGWLYDQTGTYTYSFVSAAVTLVVAAGLSFALREPARLRPAPATA
jgi:predicted MFS family arabinose efflux permease